MIDNECIILIGVLGVISLAVFFLVLLFFSKTSTTFKSKGRSVQGSREGKHVTLKEGVLRKLAIYQSAMSYEQSIRVSYQSLLAALETILFGFVFVLVELEGTSSIWMLATAGIFLCLGIGAACEFRARNVDFWRRRIEELTKGTDLEDDFRESRYGWTPYGKTGHLGERFLGHWFERLILPAIVILWGWILTW